MKSFKDWIMAHVRPIPFSEGALNALSEYLEQRLAHDRVKPGDEIPPFLKSRVDWTRFEKRITPRPPVHEVTADTATGPDPDMVARLEEVDPRRPPREAENDESLRARIKAVVHARRPAAWHCPRCGFVITSANRLTHLCVEPPRKPATPKEQEERESFARLWNTVEKYPGDPNYLTCAVFVKDLRRLLSACGYSVTWPAPRPGEPL